jgi:hypothetical protein
VTTCCAGESKDLKKWFRAALQYHAINNGIHRNTTPESKVTWQHTRRRFCKTYSLYLQT